MLRAPCHQAIDLEMEVHMEGDVLPLLFEQLQHPFPLREMANQYQQYIQSFHPKIGSVVSQYQLNPQYDEDRVKGELAMITLVAIMYITAIDARRDENTNPILNALGSAVAAIALRIRFPVDAARSNRHTQQHQEDAAITAPPPLVTMVKQALALIFLIIGSTLTFQATSDCLRACMAALPDICLGSSGGGARGRMSIDPKCIHEAAKELRSSGMDELWQLLQDHLHNIEDQSEEHQYIVHENILIICERWARFLPLPLVFLQHTVPLAKQYIGGLHQCPHHYHTTRIRKAALSYLVAIYEGATWTADQIIAKTLGFSPEQQMNQQQTKKRQSSRSKKRQKDILNTHTNDDMIEQAFAECHHRGAMACHTTVMVLETLKAAFRVALQEDNVSHQNMGEIEIEGEGPIGCLAACASACLPHLLKNSSSPPHAFPHTKELFLAISETFQEMCRSRYRVIRAFSMEPLFSLHAALIQHVLENEGTGGCALDPELQTTIVDHFFKCSMSLAISCGYPPAYFRHMEANSDEDLEIERNDVRDILRTVAISEGGGSTAFANCSRPPLEITLQILARLLQACAEAIHSAKASNCLFPETAVHCFSALAKPLNQLSKCYLKTGKPESANNILHLAFQILETSSQIVINAFAKTPLPDLFPASRTVDLAIASLSPMIASSCNNPALKDKVENVVKLCLQAAALSVVHIPELIGESELGCQIYDIRGAMRGPGGEDHVGCLGIMRLTFESDDLAQMMVNVAGTESIQHLCQLHSKLKEIEMSREKGVVYGNGVAPKSRRILLGVICHLEIVSEGRACCAAMLTGLFDSAVSAIAQADSESFHADDAVFRMCENTLDLSAFSPVIIATLFRGESDDKTYCIRNLMTCICNGYQRLALNQDSTPVDLEWNRLRAAFFTLIQRSASRDLPGALIDVVEAINRSECEAIRMQCHAGRASSSSLFNDEVVSEDSVPTGLFVVVIGRYISQMYSQNGDVNSIQNCVTALYRSKPYILQAISLPCPDPTGFVDPRPTLCESWFLVTNDLAKIALRSHIDAIPLVREILVETCAFAITSLFFPSLGKTREERANSPIMSLEGPQTLALHDFLISFFHLGPPMLEHTAKELHARVPIDTETANVFCSDLGRQSFAIIGSALFRSALGALPPWAVDAAPSLYASLFVAFGKDANAFCLMLQLALELRLSRTIASFGSIETGQLLAGPLFEDVKPAAKDNFLQEAMKICRKDDAAGWKRMKVLVKQLSGGKKSNTDFKQKPAPTKYEFDRI